jgi:hypothetical protein
MKLAGVLRLADELQRSHIDHDIAQKASSALKVS